MTISDLVWDVPGDAVGAAPREQGRLSFLQDMAIVPGNLWTGNLVNFGPPCGSPNTVSPYVNMLKFHAQWADE
jgi:hypothetical protein